MASPGAFTLDDNEEAEFFTGSASDMAQLPQPFPSLPPRPMSPTPAFSLASGLSSTLSIRVPDPPMAHVDADLGVDTLAQASIVLQQNQKRIEETEAQLQLLMRQQARLVAASRLLEQQKVLDVLAMGPEVGYDAGRPVASLLAYRCCLRWGCFSGDSQAAAVLDNLSAMLAAATDEDAITARSTAAAAAARAKADGPGGGGGGGSHGEEEVEQAAVAAATREVAYWLAVTSVLLALVDPHMPLTGGLSTKGAADNGGGGGHGASHGGGGGAPTPLAVVAGDARASVARAASAAAAKVQELQKKMNSGMQALGKNLMNLRRRGAAAAAAGPVPAPQPPRAQAQLPQAARSAGAEGGGGEEGGGGGGGVPERRLSGAPEAVPGDEPLAEPVWSAGGSPSGSPSLGGPSEQHPPSIGGASSPAAFTGAAAAAASASHSPQAFRQQLDLAVQKTYVQMRDSLKRQVSAVLPGCVQQTTPPTEGGGRLSGGGTAGGDSAAEPSGGAAGRPAAASGTSPATPPPGFQPASSSPHPAPLQPWLELTSVLSHHLALMREAHVPRILMRCLFKQTLSFIDVQLFNQLLLRPECCSTSNARYLVAGLQRLDDWITGGSAGGRAPAATAAAGEAAEASGHGVVQDGPGAAGGCGGAGEELAVLLDDLRHIRQASHFLVLANKGALRLEDFTCMCPALNVQQLYRLATTFWDDSPPPPPPPATQSSPRPSRVASGEIPAAAAPAFQDSAAAAAEAEAEAEAGGEGEGDGEGCVAAAAEGAGAHVEEGEGQLRPQQQQSVGEEEENDVAEGAGAGKVVRTVEDQAAAATTDEAGDAATELEVPSAAATAAAAAASVSRNVSGEVLEEMKRRHCVANNGGLIVTFLLDEDGAPLIVQGGGGAVARQLLAIINEPRLHEGLAEGLPPPLRSEDCPPQAFAFMLDGVGGAAAAAAPMPPPAASVGASAVGH